MNPQATLAEFAASLPRILEGRDPIAFTPPEFYRHRVQRFAVALGNRPDGPIAVSAKGQAGEEELGFHADNLALRGCGVT